MLGSQPAAGLALLSSAASAASIARASGTQVPIDLYTDIQCETPSTTSANVSLALDTCAVTPGLGSLVLRPTPCQSGDVLVYAFSDTSCGTQDDIFTLGSNCDGRANPGVYAAIMLSCNQEEPDAPTARTTIDVGPIATSGSSPSAPVASGASASSAAVASSGTATSAAAPSTTPAAGTPSTSTPSGSSSSSSSSSSGSSSGWDSFSTGAKVGIIIASIVGALGLGGASYALNVQCCGECHYHAAR